MFCEISYIIIMRGKLIKERECKIMRKKLLFVVMAICLSVTACGKSDSKKETVKNVGNEAVSSSGVEDESDTESDTKDEDDKESKKDEDTDIVYIEYYYGDANYTLPMMHDYTETGCKITDSSEIFLVMSELMGTMENGEYNPDRVVDLDKILEENKKDLDLNCVDLHIDDKEYVIDSSKEYTTKTGIKGIKYEGRLANDTTSYYFYAFVFNSEKNSYQYIGFSSNQIMHNDIEYDLDAAKKKIKTTMDKSIDTIRLD